VLPAIGVNPTPEASIYQVNLLNKWKSSGFWSKGKPLAFMPNEVIDDIDHHYHFLALGFAADYVSFKRKGPIKCPPPG
jgi:hypothetical protein